MVLTQQNDESQKCDVRWIYPETDVHIRLFHLYEGLEQAISLYHNRNQIIVDWGWEWGRFDCIRIWRNIFGGYISYFNSGVGYIGAYICQKSLN